MNIITFVAKTNDSIIPKVSEDQTAFIINQIKLLSSDAYDLGELIIIVGGYNHFEIPFAIVMAHSLVTVEGDYTIIAMNKKIFSPEPDYSIPTPTIHNVFIKITSTRSFDLEIQIEKKYSDSHPPAVGDVFIETKTVTYSTFCISRIIDAIGLLDGIYFYINTPITKYEIMLYDEERHIVAEANAKNKLIWQKTRWTLDQQTALFDSLSDCFPPEIINMINEECICASSYYLYLVDLSNIKLKRDNHNYNFRKVNIKTKTTNYTGSIIEFFGNYQREMAGLVGHTYSS